MSILSSPLTAFDEKKDFSLWTIMKLIMLMMCSGLSAKLLIGFPFKTPPIMMLTAACAFSACSSSVMLSKDTYDRFTH